jgi:sarcosine oxidase
VTHYDVIVLGVGGMGSAAAYHLARRGRSVLAIEQFSLGHDLGSSHGVTRIIRLAYAEHPAYVPLLRRAYDLWREMERTTGERLLVITGGLDIGLPQGAMVTGSLRSCREHAIPHELLEVSEVNRRFPGYRLPAEMVAVYQADGGFVLPERSIALHVMAALDLGAEVHGCERVTGWDAANGEVEVRTDRGAYRAARLVITAGAWAAQAVPRLKTLAVPERQVLLWTQPLRPELFTPAAFPIFNLEAPEGHFYGFPVYSVPGVKMGRFHHRDEQVNPDRMNRECDAADEAVVRQGIERYLPDANGPTLAMKTCLFTNAPDGHFILDRLPEYPQVSIAAGFSGHGFKFAPVIGEIMADFALEGGSSRFALDLFRLGRF